MDSFYLKCLSAALIFVVALLGGLVPLLARSRGRSQAVLLYGDYFARGVFIGAAFIHLLPDAMASFQESVPNVDYPVIMLVCAITVFVVQFIEQGLVVLYRAHCVARQQWLPFLLATLLSIHSLITGGALGLGDNVTHVMIMLIAIIAHKGAAAFALSVSMCNAGLTKTAMQRILLLFAMMTPIGIFLGAGFDLYAQANEAVTQLGYSLFNAVAAGTFIYIAAYGESENQPASQINIAHIIYFGVGVLVMAAIAIVV